MAQLAGDVLPRVASSDAALERALPHAITFLQQRQLSHGEFQTFGAADESLTVACHPDSSNFVTALVVYAIGWSDDPRVSTLISRGLDFLSSEMEGAGLWRYWSWRNSRHNFLPPDLDDTCCISYLLRKHNRPLPDNKALVLHNRDARGIFYTWLTTRHSGQAKNLSRPLRDQIRRVSDPDIELILSLSGTMDNIDCAVNANVLLYLGESQTTQPALDFLIETVQENHVRARSTYYFHPLAFYYLLSRAFANGISALERTRVVVLQYIESAQTQNGSFGNPLFTALAGCTLLNFREFGLMTRRATESLLKTQAKDGSWARHAMFLGPAPYYGSEELTTALCIEALAKYRNSL